MENTSYNDQNIAKYLSGELEDKNIEHMERDLMNDREKEQQMKDFTRLWEKSSEIGNYDSLNINEDWEKVRTKMGFRPHAKRIPLRKYALRIAAILILALGLTYFLSTLINTVPEQNSFEYIQVASANQTKLVTLPDNSEITLNENSKIIYNNNFGVNNRDLILEGEAYFEVHRNEEIPFKVFVDNSTVEVLGTSFNINSFKNNVRVSVTSGKVAFYETAEKNNRIELVKDEQSEYNGKNHLFGEKKSHAPNAITWKTGALKFNDESYSEVFDYLEQYFDAKIVVETNQISTRTIGDIEFRLDDSLSEILENMMDAAGNEYVVVELGNNYIVKRKALN